MAKHRSLFVDYLVFLAIRVLIGLIEALPFGAGCRVASFFAWLAYHVDRRHRQVALENLRYAFPGQFDEAASKRLVARVYEHFFLLLFEVAHLRRRMHPTNWTRIADFRSPQDARLLLGTLLAGRPVLLATGHFGNWELAGYLLSLVGFKIHSIARTLDNRYLDAYLRDFRQARGQVILSKNGDFERMRAVLAEGGILGTLADQDAGPKGLFVDFFNRPASTHKAVALLALEHQVTIVVTATVRVGGPFQYRSCVEDVIDPADYVDHPDAIRAITQRYMSALERLVRQHPEQYFWLHRRWKHLPPVKKTRKAA